MPEPGQLPRGGQDYRTKYILPEPGQLPREQAQPNPALHTDTSIIVNVMVLLESVVTGHKYIQIRERLAEKMEVIMFDPYILSTSKRNKTVFEACVQKQQHCILGLFAICCPSRILGLVLHLAMLVGKDSSSLDECSHFNLQAVGLRLFTIKQ
uniref:Uncharacterized protein n=1 Tax=Timema cristinae TaxID=61476 RepID=A0A7R9CWS2_TIMCR|nr:unnamed protein product [Timema cristinae]